MSVYRGPGGAGDATNEATSQAALAIEAAQEAAISAAAAAGSAANAATSAEIASDAVMSFPLLLSSPSPIGNVLPNTGAFTTLSSTGIASLGASSTVGGVDIVTTSGTQTLTNKTLTAPVIATISNSGTITIPTGTRTLVARDTTDTLTNKTLTAPVISTISNSGTITLPTGTRTLVARDTTDTLTNKTLTAPVISTIVNTGTLTLPTTTDTLVGRATTDILTNKTLTAPTVTNGTFSSPTLTGTPIAPTAASGTNTTQIATTAFVQQEMLTSSVTLNGVQTLTNKTLTAPVLNTSTFSGGTINNATVGATTPSSGVFTTLRANSLAKVRASSPTAQSIPNNTVTDITNWSELQDVSASFVPTTGVFTAPRTGSYLVTAQVALAGAAFAAINQSMSVILTKNASIVTQAITSAQTTTAVALTSPCLSHVLDMTAGDTLKIQAYQNSGAAISTTGNTNTFLTITELP